MNPSAKVENHQRVRGPGTVILTHSPIKPRPPESPRPPKNVTSEYTRVVMMEQYHKPSRHPLLAELNDIVSSGLKLLEQSGPNPNSSTDGGVDKDFSVARLEVYRDAFQRYIEEFNIYRPFLSEVKHEYDSVIETLWNKLHASSSIRSHLAAIEKKHVAEIHEIEHANSQKIQILEEENKRLEALFNAKVREFDEREEEMGVLRASSAKARKEWEEMRTSCLTLTNSLARLDEEKKQAHAKDAIKTADMANLRIQVQRATEEVERSVRDW